MTEILWLGVRNLKCYFRIPETLVTYYTEKIMIIWRLKRNKNYHFRKTQKLSISYQRKNKN